jgi:hypothetical protein
MTQRSGGQAGQTVAALQAALAAEQAASYGYGIVGAHLSGAKFDLASSCCVAHERARDNLIKLITARGATPRAAAVAYQLPIRVSDPAQAVSLAIVLERKVATAYLGLVAVTDPALRTYGAAQLAAATVRATKWGGRSQAFPGLPSVR